MIYYVYSYRSNKILEKSKGLKKKIHANETQIVQIAGIVQTIPQTRLDIYSFLLSADSQTLTVVLFFRNDTNVRELFDVPKKKNHLYGWSE